MSGQVATAGRERIALSRASGVCRIALSRVGRVGRGVRWYVRELTGEAAYDRYVAAHARTHPDHAPLTRAQWWRARDDARESMAHERCC
ncbi:YbdD/YjiX family protein [Cellulomonas dongxiuzhuiae]|uniref:YbdD/YjiX family protein n=2 Tax=Cellulomonas dongxiuzhuiae TaxID=2819979 RepID=A0ABX8GGY4_9CELL|nr:YbdD/YjiX family protein [Cellulomonas dongxiuzhuiae]QWC15088.1 YbdD/YjiX family protein [Cellulomonas dongxiuzhuiae]